MMVMDLRRLCALGRTRVAIVPWRLWGQRRCRWAVPTVAPQLIQVQMPMAGNVALEKEPTVSHVPAPRACGEAMLTVSLLRVVHALRRMRTVTVGLAKEM